MTRIYLYHPTCELALANGTHSYRPPERLRIFEADLSTILCFLAQPTDIIVSDHELSKSFTRQWEACDFLFPKTMGLKEAAKWAKKNPSNWVPWGESPMAEHLIQSAMQSGTRFRPSTWSLEKRLFYSRLTSAHFENVLQSTELPPRMKTENRTRIIQTERELQQFLVEYPNTAVLKSIWSASGRGIHFIRDAKSHSPILKWATARLNTDGAIIAEVLLNKVADLSFLFSIHPDGNINFDGINYFSASSDGEFDKEWIGLSPAMQNLIDQNRWSEKELKIYGELLIGHLQAWQYHNHYTGPIGMDAMIWEDETGELRIRCCVEINFRHHMGLINQAIKARFADKTTGHWEITQFAIGEWRRFCEHQRQLHPLQIKNGKITEGFFTLTPVEENSKYGVWGVATKPAE